MRLPVCIVASAICLFAEAAGIRFTKPAWRPDLGIAVPCLEGAVGEPLDPPRAEAYLVTEDAVRRLEDRFDVDGLWLCHAMRGRWSDADGRRLFLARLGVSPPESAPGSVSTRTDFYRRLALRRFDARDKGLRDAAVADVSPVAVTRAVRPRRERRQNLAELVAYVTEADDRALVYAFRPRSPERGETPDWYLAVLVAAETDDMAEVRAHFDEDFLDAISLPAKRNRLGDVAPLLPPEGLSEADLLRHDLARSVANYDEWSFSASDGVAVIDDLDAGTRAAVVTSITNALPRLRREYARVAPSPLAATNELAAVRVFATRREYLAYVGVEQKWTAAVWSPARRELVLCCGDGGPAELLRTAWHEAFHQYLAYAGSMVSASPWFNEGHADLFAGSRFDRRTGEVAFERDARAAAFVHEYAPQLAEAIPALLAADYEEFYSGTPEEVRMRYDLAWSIAYFLEVGAPKLRFRPYEGLRRDYMDALVETKSMHEATNAALWDERREKFIASWLEFWRK